MTKLIFRLKGGEGSGNAGHAGRPGHQGGSAPQGKRWHDTYGHEADQRQLAQHVHEGAVRGMQNAAKLALHKPSFAALTTQLGEGLAYIVHNALRDVVNNQSNPTQAFIDSVENENYYGKGTKIVAGRNKAKAAYIAILHKDGIVFDESKWSNYEEAQD